MSVGLRRRLGIYWCLELHHLLTCSARPTDPLGKSRLQQTTTGQALEVRHTTNRSEQLERLLNLYLWSFYLNLVDAGFVIIAPGSTDQQHLRQADLCVQI
jgi:hypothetical protein